MPEGKECPIGYYCQNGLKTACLSGTYQDNIGQDQCKQCPAGYQCPLNSVTNVYDSLEIVGPNHYSAAGVADKTACSNDGNGNFHKYHASNAESSNDACVPCPDGYTCKCPFSGGSLQCVLDFAKCPAGKFCSNGVEADCGAGYVCPEGTPVRIPCPPGKYCPTDTEGDISALQDCDAGYYCDGTASTA